MAIIVVGGSGRNVGKTSLVCGLISGLAEFRWSAVKVSTHDHGKPKPVWEETTPGTETDTARYLKAGAERALLGTPPMRDDSLGADFPLLLKELWRITGSGANLIFESNGIVEYLEPDLCLALGGGPEDGTWKPSFTLLRERAHAIVARAATDRAKMHVGGAKPTFELAFLERPSQEMLAWVRQELHAAPGS
ncbi:MAG: hypothetical protein WBQ94_16355 [Terracidiphilus sp.]